MTYAQTTINIAALPLKLNAESSEGMKLIETLQEMEKGEQDKS